MNLLFYVFLCAFSVSLCLCGKSTGVV
ncbi:hypothetical protein MTBUT4_30017 [Magnetospirillum sp. UT-4]|nr:hypothetical protein MTBUT4_30017 [Magnetospirillum sp. UT-4]